MLLLCEDKNVALKQTVGYPISIRLYPSQPRSPKTRKPILFAAIETTQYSQVRRYKQHFRKQNLAYLHQNQEEIASLNSLIHNRHCRRAPKEVAASAKGPPFNTAFQIVCHSI